jgi:hypothetical protein
LEGSRDDEVEAATATRPLKHPCTGEEWVAAAPLAFRSLVQAVYGSSEREALCRAPSVPLDVAQVWAGGVEAGGVGAGVGAAAVHALPRCRLAYNALPIARSPPLLQAATRTGWTVKQVEQRAGELVDLGLLYSDGNGCFYRGDHPHQPLHARPVLPVCSPSRPARGERQAAPAAAAAGQDIAHGAAGGSDLSMLAGASAVMAQLGTPAFHTAAAVATAAAG